MARLDLGLDRGEAGWPATPGIGAAMKRMTDAQEAHERQTSIRQAIRERDASLIRLGRSLLESLSDGSISERQLPQPVRNALEASRSATEAARR